MDAVGKLRRYAKKKGVKVRFRSNIRGAMGYYRIVAKEVILSSKLKKKRNELIYTLAHELGHAADFMGMSKKDWKLFVSCTGAFNFWNWGEIFISKRRLRKLRTIIIEGEQVAYDNGEEILEELGISLPPAFMRRSRKKGIDSYRRVFSSYLG